ncbi:hypothetical protein CVT24_000008 [Panaeolus cyanescens]|uniref:AAA+ ATPase domain-containing protein n=1 Tax=Panaeolus cyanescens TaxID=181874 RepID=A0A409VS96_9AGAR|nr:hypothetical protein CVT24_000008 [Panaeolus cyanescens]
MASICTDIQEDDIVIAVLGATGVGKSAFIRAVAGRDVPGLVIGNALHTVTTDIVCVNIPIPGANFSLVLVDTPGFDVVDKSDAENLEIITKWLQSTYKKQILLTSLVYLHRITDIRHDAGAKATMDILKGLAGSKAFKRTTLVTTMWNDLRDEELGVDRERQLESGRWRPMIDEGATTARFYANDRQTAVQIILDIVAKDIGSKTVLLKMQDELVNKKKMLPFTSAGKSVFTFKQAMKWRLHQLRAISSNLRLFPLCEARYSSVSTPKQFILWTQNQKHHYASTNMSLVPNERSGEGRPEPVRLNTLVDLIVAAEPVHASEIQLDDIIIAVMGPTGVGKTTFIRAVAGEHIVGLDVGHSLSAGTTGIKCVKIPIPEAHSNLILVDTPGFDDPDKSDAEILETIATWLEKTYRKKILLSGLVYLHRITDVRHDAGLQTTMNIFQRLTGPGAYERVALVTSMWNDLLDTQIGLEREAQLMKTQWRTMIIRKATTGRFDSENRQSAVRVIRDIVEKDMKRVSLQLQHELVDKNKSLPSTSAGKVAFTLREAIAWRFTHLTGALKLDD